MYASVRPMNRSTTSASVIAQPSCASTATSTRTAMRSLSTSTPSQSKMTSRMELLRVDRVGGLSSAAAQLPVIPGDDARRREAERHALGSLLQDAGARLGGQRGTRVAGHQAKPDLAHACRIALDCHIALEHRAAQLAVHVASGLDLQGRARVALEVPDLLGLAVRPAQEGGSL